MIDNLFQQALRANISIADFWDSTPAEIYVAIDAYGWGLEQKQKQLAWAVWHIAALTRAKKMPPLSSLVKPAPAKKLTEEEKLKRQKEFEEMVEKNGRNNTGDVRIRASLENLDKDLAGAKSKISSAMGGIANTLGDIGKGGFTAFAGAASIAQTAIVAGGTGLLKWQKMQWQ